MNSCLYRCKVRHSRTKPKQHRFAYDCFVFCIDLDEIPKLSKKLRLFAHNSRAPYALRDSDHLEIGGSTIRENVESFLRIKGVSTEPGRIDLVTNLRTWGYVFNPVSFYFVYDKEQQPLCVVAEVANTFNEQKLYLVESRNEKTGTFRQSHKKLFYISPFSSPDTHLNFALNPPEDRISLSITENDSEGTYFISSLQGKRTELSDTNLLRYTLRFPFITLKVIAAIHWEAARLYLKKIPFFRKTYRQDLQTETRVYLRRDNRHA